MEYASPDFDEMNARFDRRGSRLSEIERLLEELPSFPEISDRTERAALLERRRQLLSEIGRIEEKIRDDDSFPDHVAGAINVLCYEEIWRLRWSSDEKDDRRAAQAIARARTVKNRTPSMLISARRARQLVFLIKSTKRPSGEHGNARDSCGHSFQACSKTKA